LPPRYKDHALGGDWFHHRECHIEPDRLYKIDGNPAQENAPIEPGAATSVVERIPAIEYPFAIDAIRFETEQYRALEDAGGHALMHFGTLARKDGATRS